MRSLPPLTALRTFEVAAEQLNFTIAAQILCVTQGAVSRQIKVLEDYLGLALFIRNHHNLELTDAGKHLLSSLNQSFNIMETAITEIRTPNQRQKLNLLVPPTLATRWLAARLPDFRKKYPEIELAIYERANNQVIFDCEIRFGENENNKLDSQLLFLEQHIPVCPPALLDRANHLENESSHFLNILHNGKKLPVWKDWLTKAGLLDLIDTDNGMAFSTLDQVISALKAGAGFAIIEKRMITNELHDQSLVQFSDIEITGPFGYWLDIPKDKQGLSKVIHFSNWLQEQIVLVD